MSKILIVAGESSGDLHGSNLVKALKKIEPDIDIFGLGGKKMLAAGVRIHRDLTKHAIVGFFEGAMSYPRIVKTFFSLLREAKEEKPDAAVLIDYPEFNMRFAKRLKRLKIPVIYYICPQVWAWREYRVRALKKYVDKFLVILPFEEEFYNKFGIAAEFVGHPILDCVDEPESPEDLRNALGIPKQNRIIGLLPGSRRAEVKRLFPILRAGVSLIKRQIPNLSFVVGLAPSIKQSRLELENPKLLVWHNARQLMRASDLLLACSGTATLEATIFGTPMIMLYRLNTLTWMAFVNMVRIKNFALCNIVAGRQIIPELIQGKAKPDIVAKYAIKMLCSPKLPEIRKSLLEVKEKLGKPGASERAARSIIDFLHKKS